MAIQKIFFLSAIFILLSLIPFHSMAEVGPTKINFWPLFQYTSDPMEGIKEISGLGPLFLWRKEPRQEEWGIRPLLYRTRDEREPLERVEFLYPFGKYQVKEGERRGYLAPLSLYKEEFDGKKRWDFQFFPFYVGETREGRGYVGLFPIFGTLYDRYGKDEIRFYLWPLYSESVFEGVRTKNLLWPFFSVTEGEKKRGYRFWPIYGQKEEIGVSYKEFFLWPIFIHQRKGIDTEDPVEEKMIFPLYVSKESKRFESKTFLWPFFSHTIDRPPGFEQWDFPWPILQSLKGENLRGMRIFPFYGYKVREGEMRRVFVLYPLYQFEEDRTDDVQERTTRILLLSRIRTGKDNKGVGKRRSLRIWPFFDYEKDEVGHERLSFFYLLPFKEEGLERNLFPLFRIFRREKDPKSGTSTNLLWGFYKRMKKEEVDSWEIAHLIGMKREKEQKTVSFLKGLFLYKSDGKSADLRFFYLPFHLRWPRQSHQRGKDVNSNLKEFTDGRQEDRNIGDRVVSSGKDPFQF